MLFLFFSLLIYHITLEFCFNFTFGSTLCSCWRISVPLVKSMMSFSENEHENNHCSSWLKVLQDNLGHEVKSWSNIFTWHFSCANKLETPRPCTFRPKISTKISRTALLQHLLKLMKVCSQTFKGKDTSEYEMSQSYLWHSINTCSLKKNNIAVCRINSINPREQWLQLKWEGGVLKKTL